MKNLFLISILFATATATGAAVGHADESPFEQDSVWEQQQSGSVDAFFAKVNNVNPKGLKVTFEKLEPGEAPVVQTVKICTTDEAVNGDNHTEADRAMIINQRLNAFRSAKKDGGTLKVAVRGPWSPCVYPVSI